MGGFNKNVICIFPVLIGVVFSLESCSITIAESSLANRTQQYNQHLQDTNNKSMFKQLCRTQIRPDRTELDFEDAIKLCTNAEVDIIQQKWVNLNRNITEICQQDCPDMMQLPVCKNMTYLGGIEFSRYERFCRTFNTSLLCANDATNNCVFGLTMYAAILEPIVQSYWKYICNSGCGNIDETVASITQCIQPLKTANQSTTCRFHYEFKECIRQTKNLCPEVLKLVRFIYRKYDRVDRYCTTTTTVTTTPLPETTTPLTETPEVTEPVTTSVPTVTNAVTEIPDVTKFVTTELTTTTAPTKIIEVTDKAGIRIEDCLSAEDLEVISAGEINLNSVVVYLKLESCLHNNTSDARTVEMIRETFPGDVQSFHSRVKSEAWQVLLQQVQCKQENNEETSGCSGHDYGLIPCNSVTIPTFNFLVVLLCLVLSKLTSARTH